MAKSGIDNIFIANQIVGDIKLHRIKKLVPTIDISFGVDSIEHIEAIERIFQGEDRKAQVLIEIEVGENRSGVIEKDNFIKIAKYIKSSNNIYLKGIFSHDGHSYGAKDLRELKEIFISSQKRTLEFAKLARDLDYELEVVSIGSTPSLMHDFPILEGITEIRPGTYILMDTAQGNGVGNYNRCAATVLSTVISKPTEERVIIDVGAKGITMQTRPKGICATKGLGYIKNYDVYIERVFDEHGIINDREFRDKITIGDKVEIIPNHICPVCNLYDKVYLVSEGEVVDEIQIAGRGKLT